MPEIERDFSGVDNSHCELCGEYNRTCMNSVLAANTVGFLSALFVLLGVTDITTQDLTGFLNVVAALVAVVSFIWSHSAHKKALAAAGVPTNSSL